MSYGAVLNPAAKPKEAPHPLVLEITKVTDPDVLQAIMQAAQDQTESSVARRCASRLVKELSGVVDSVENVDQILRIVRACVGIEYPTEPEPEPQRRISRAYRSRGTTYPSPAEVHQRLAPGVYKLKEIVEELGLDPEDRAHEQAIRGRVETLVNSGKLKDVDRKPGSTAPRHYRKE